MDIDKLAHDNWVRQLQRLDNVAPAPWKSHPSRYTGTGELKPICTGRHRVLVGYKLCYECGIDITKLEGPALVAWE